MRDRLLAAEKVKAIDWRDDALYLLDQRILPFEENWLAYTGVDGVAQAIRDMVTQSAGPYTAAAMGMALAAYECREKPAEEQLRFLQAAETRLLPAA